VQAVMHLRRRPGERHTIGDLPLSLNRSDDHRAQVQARSETAAHELLNLPRSLATA
jgi:hypothetical protein